MRAGHLGMGWLGLAGLWLVGCAQVGPVLPPSAHLPRPVEDLRATRRGPVIEFSFTPPQATSDGLSLRGPVAYNFCAWPGVVGQSPPPAAHPVPPPTAKGAHPASPAVPEQIPGPRARNLGGAETPSGATMPPCAHVRRLQGTAVNAGDLGAAGVVTVALYAVNRQGEGAGWSNPVTVPLTPVGPPPDLLLAQPTAAGVQLRWQVPTPVPARVAVYRSGERIAELDGGVASYLDAGMQWNQHYQYWLRSVAGSGGEAVESADSRHLNADTKDVFPPPAPATACRSAGAAGVDLSWDAVNVPDLASYNVYRRAAAGGAWEKRNTAPVLTPVYHDSAAPGQYAYAVTAVDSAGNESPHSAPVQASVVGALVFGHR